MGVIFILVVLDSTDLPPLEFVTRSKSVLCVHCNVMA